MNHNPHALQTFRKLHESGCFVMPNPWDVGSAIYLQQLGFPALATTSAGFGFSRGLPDTVEALSRETVIEHVREIVAATPLPVNADFQNGYADEPERVARHVAECLRTGVAGLSIEDATGKPSEPLYPRDIAIERVRAACQARDNAVPEAVITARCEAFLVGAPNPGQLSLDRLVAFAEVGADCLYAPGVQDLGLIAEIVSAVAPKPVNILVSAPSPDLSVERLANLGVRRVSVGSALARVAYGAFTRAAADILQTGAFGSLDSAASFTELSRVFERRQSR